MEIAGRQSEPARFQIDSQSPFRRRNNSLEPAPPAIKTAAAENQYEYDDDEKCR